MKTKIIDLSSANKIVYSEDTIYFLIITEMNKNRTYDLDVVFNKTDISGELVGLFNLRSENSLKLNITINHEVPETRCEVNIREILSNNAKSEFLGKIVIQKNAQNTESSLNHNVLIVGNGTSNISSPVLQIYNNDVQVSHASTTSRVAEDDLFYLTSRGLNRAAAEELLIEGFFKSLFEKVDDEIIKKKIAEYIGVKL